MVLNSAQFVVGDAEGKIILEWTSAFCSLIYILKHSSTNLFDISRNLFSKRMEKINDLSIIIFFYLHFAKWNGSVMHLIDTRTLSNALNDFQSTSE